MRKLTIRTGNKVDLDWNLNIYLKPQSDKVNRTSTEYCAYIAGLIEPIVYPSSNR